MVVVVVVRERVLVVRERVLATTLVANNDETLRHRYRHRHDVGGRERGGSGSGVGVSDLVVVGDELEHLVFIDVVPYPVRSRN